MSLFTPASPSRWLTTARSIMLGWILLSILIMIVSLPMKFESMRSLEPGAVSQTPFYGWTLEQIRHQAQTQGMQPEWIAGIMFSASIICLVCYWAVAGLLFWRKSDTWAGLLVAFILFTTGPGFSNLLLSEGQAPEWINRLYQAMAVVTWPTFFVMLYLFPNGNFIPQITRFLMVLPYGLFILTSFSSRWDAIGTTLLLAYAIGGLVSQVYRYQRVSTPDERQQTKWVVLGVGIFIGVLPTSLIIPALFPSLAVGTLKGFWYEFIGNGVLGILIPALLPLALGASILRYRLWDIDVIIRRTLQYTLVTGLLALVFFGGVTLLQAIFSSITGEQSSLAIALSTLGIAALFNPLRKQVQSFIDRRFYRRKYDAERALAEFAATARNETDLGQLTSQMFEAVQGTLQPEKMSLWLKPAAKAWIPPVNREGNLR